MPATISSSPTPSIAGSRNSVCHGRVKEKDFEKMIPTQWWKDLFDDLYLKTDGDVVEDPEITKEEIKMLEASPSIMSILNRGRLPTEPDCNTGQEYPKILDLCCGQGRHSILLGQRYPGLKIYGHDQSAYLIELARERAAQIDPVMAAIPKFSVGDCRNVPLGSDMFDFVMVMGNSFGYFSANDKFDDDDDYGDQAVLKEINRLLKHGGSMVLDLADGDYIRENFSPRSWEWIDDETFACRERTLSADRKRLHSREVVVVTGRGVVRDQFYSERLYGRQELLQLLREAGFHIESGDVEQVEEEGVTVTAARELSQRGQDLGMMEQRLLIFAQKQCQHPRLVKRQSLAEQTAKQLIERNRSENSLPHTLNSSAVPVRSGSCPSDYHLLPPPQFPTGSFGIIFGDTSLPCREKLNGNWNLEDIETRKKLVDALLECGYLSNQVVPLESHKNLVKQLAASSPYFIFNLCDEGFMNDALKELHVPSLLEMLEYPYSGAGPVCLGVCYDKGLVNSTAYKLDIPTPRETYILFSDLLDRKDLSVDELEAKIRSKEKSQEIRYPAFVKPMKGDNSLGITSRSVCQNRDELISYIQFLINEYDLREFIIQEYLVGTEFSVGMIGNIETGFHFFPILQVDYSKITENYGLQPILGWESKWDPQSPYWNEVNYFPAPAIPPASNEDCGACNGKLADSESCWVTGGGLTVEEEAELKRMCIVLFERFGCRDYARFDWRADREIQWNSQTGRVKPHDPLIPSVTDSPLHFPQPAPQPSDLTLDETASITANGPTGQDQFDANNASDEVLSATTEKSFSSESVGGGVANASDSGHGSNSASSEDLSLSASLDRRCLRTLKLLEVNPNPGWCWDGKLAKMAQFEGKTYPQLLKMILRASWERIYGQTATSV